MRRIGAAAAPILLLFLLSGLLLSTGCAVDSAASLSRIEQRIRGLLEIHTFEHLYREVVYFGEERSLLFLRTMDRRVLFSINIRVRAGVDLRDGFELRGDSLRPERLFVRLPTARILLVDADERSIEQYFVREQGGAIRWLELADHLESVKETVRQDAIERGILLRADQNAERVVRNMLELAGFTDVQISRGPSPPESSLELPTRESTQAEPIRGAAR